MSIVLGVDSSTQSTKAEARNITTGEVVAQASAPHPGTAPPVSEQDPTAWWNALVSACGGLGEARSEVTAVSVAGQQHGLVLLDEHGEALRPAKLWNDTESAPEASEMVTQYGAAGWADAVGSVPVAAFTITKLRWVANHHPELLDRVAMVMLPHDYLTWRLTGHHTTDRGDASGSGWFDPSTNTYRPELLDLAGVDGAAWLDRLPLVVAPREAAGVLTEAAASALGLPPGIAVGPGTGDNMAGALGLGIDHGDVAISLGTSGVAFSASATSTHDPDGAVAGFADATGSFLPLVCTLNATKVTDTVAGWLGTDARGLADLAVAADPTSTTGPVLVPYFDGERTPNLPDASGTFAGLRTATTREELALAAHDGVLCGLLAGVDALSGAGVATDGDLRLIGGGARSVAYRQRCADLWGRPVLIPHADETVATGAAVQAAVVAGNADFSEVQEAWRLGDAHRVEPNAGVDNAAVRARYAEASGLGR
jgi:xylulokinase